MRLWLVKNGVHYDVAFSLEDEDLLTYCIIFGTFEGNKWDWNAMGWKDKS